MNANKKVVVIGSGFGGLLSALLLAKAGCQVDILEQNKQIGGCLQTFAFQKKIFDSAIHYLGSLDEGQTLYQIFAYAGILSDLQLKPMPTEGFDLWVKPDGNTLAMPVGWSALEQSLIAAFPEELNGIRAYCALVQETCAAFPMYYLRNDYAGDKFDYLSRSMGDVFLQLALSEGLQSMICSNAILYAGTEDTPWATHALIVNSYVEGPWKLTGGSSQISKLLWRQLQKLNVRIFKSEQVVKLRQDEGKVIEAITASGKSFLGDIFIANIHPKALIPLLENPLTLKKRFLAKINQADETIACLMINAVLQPGTVVYRHHNLNWNFANPMDSIKMLASVFPSNYSIYFTEDPSNPGYAETVSILCYIQADEFNTWEKSINHTNAIQDRGPNYESFKTEKAQKVLDKIGEHFPDITQNVVALKVATPLTYRDYQGSIEGSLYGMKKSAKTALQMQLASQTKIENLLLTGQNLNLHGLLGVAMNALLCVSGLLDLDQLLLEIKAAKKS